MNMDTATAPAKNKTKKKIHNSKSKTTSKKLTSNTNSVSAKLTHSGTENLSKKLRPNKNQQNYVEQEKYEDGDQVEYHHDDQDEDVHGDDHGAIVQHVLQLGGSKKDLDLLDVDIGSDVEDLEFEDDDTEPIKRDDILQFISNLGIRKERPDFAQKKEKSKKLVTSEYVPAEAPTTSKKEKKSKNKFKLQDNEVTSTTPPEPVSADAEDPISGVADLTNLLAYIETGYSKRSYPLIKPGRWLAQLESKDSPVHSGQPHPQISEIEKFAQQVFNDDISIYSSNITGASKSDVEWRKRMVSSGTLADRAAALTTLVQEDVVHNLSSLESLVSMVKKKGRRESMTAIGPLKDVFLDLLPNKRKLRAFHQMPLETLQHHSSGNKDTQDRILALWHFEARLKAVYSLFIEAVLAATFDSVSAHKQAALKVVLDLLSSKPEQEQKLLPGLVNKLGDPERKIAANVAHLLSCLVKKHPNMKMVVASEVMNILYRPNISKKAQYYSICFLNQMILSEHDVELAVKLITIYFSFFKATVKSQEVDSKMMSALLVGVVRAFPFAKDSKKLNLDEQINAIYKLVHTVNKFSVSLQALMLLYQVCSTSDSMADRFYTSLYAKLLDPELKSSSKQAMFLHLVYKSMKSDPSDRRCKAFVKRLLQICAHQSPTFVCSTLITISEIVKLKPTLISLKSSVLADEESDEEHFVDADSDSEEADSNLAQNKDGGNSKGWTHASSKSDKYDSLARNPLYCHADKCIETELVALANHYHPSVAVFANHLLNSESIIYKGDPMADFSLQKFLDRFVFRNPKKVVKQDKAKHALSSHKNRELLKKSAGVAVNSEEFYNMELENVPADQRFFHRYFHKLTDSSKHKLGSHLGMKEKAADSDGSEVDDDDFDSYLHKYEKSLYADLKEDLFGADFASDFKKKSLAAGDKGKKSDAEDDGSDPESGDSDEDDEAEDLGLKPSDFGLDDDDLNDEIDPEEDVQVSGDAESDDSGDLPLDMDDEAMEGVFAPAPDFDEENVEFSDDEFGDFGATSKAKKTKDIFKSSKNKLTKKSRNSGSVFAAAEEFADLLDEESADLLDSTSSNAVVNRGKASAKQLAWEDKQERWLSGSKRNSRKPANKRRRK